MIASLPAVWKKIDVLVNNAGLSAAWNPCMKEIPMTGIK